MVSPATAISALWIAWLVGWLLAARGTARTVARQTIASRLAHSVPIWGGAALLLVPSHRLALLLRPILPHNTWIGWLGAALVAGGLCFTGWARIHLGRYWSGIVALKAEHALIRSGPYALVRHPIYTGLLLALAGTLLARGTLGALLGFSLLVLGVLLKIRQEEQLLVGHFGAAYRDYQALVPAVVPRFRSSS